jgi:COP9 signalosome complex subunit 1
LTYLAQAELALKTGSVAEALKAFNQVRENCSGAAHNVELGLAILQGTLQFNDTSVVSGNTHKTSASLDRLYPASSAGDAPVSSTMTRLQVEQSRTQAARSAEVRRAVGVKLRVARGLLAINAHEYSRAARELGEVGEEGGLGEWDGVVISTADLAFLTAILALASGTRDYIKRVLLDRPSFHAAVDDSQSWILDLVRAFVGAAYGEALTILRKAEVSYRTLAG